MVNFSTTAGSESTARFTFESRTLCDVTTVAAVASVSTSLRGTGAERFSRVTSRVLGSKWTLRSCCWSEVARATVFVTSLYSGVMSPPAENRSDVIVTSSRFDSREWREACVRRLVGACDRCVAFDA